MDLAKLVGLSLRWRLRTDVELPARNELERSLGANVVTPRPQAYRAIERVTVLTSSRVRPTWSASHVLSRGKLGRLVICSLRKR